MQLIMHEMEALCAKNDNTSPWLAHHKGSNNDSVLAKSPVMHDRNIFRRNTYTGFTFRTVLHVKL